MMHTSRRPLVHITILLLSAFCMVVPAVRASATASSCSWQLVPAPNFGPASYGLDFDFLNQASSVGPNNVWFAGTYAAPRSEGYGFNYELLHWNGTRLEAMPHPPPMVNDLVGPVAISFDSANDGWFTANYLTTTSAVNFRSFYLQGFAAHWNGTGWTVTPLAADPRVSTVTIAMIGDTLYSVRAISPTDAWAVGAFGAQELGSLIERWDGSQWTIVPNPADQTAGAVLRGIWSSSRTDIWAVGYQPSADQSYVLPLVEHWDGISWKVVTTPLPVTVAPGSALNAVGGDSSTDVWAVGDSVVGRTPGNVIEHWNGTTWTIVSGAPGARATRLRSVQANSPTDVWTVGIGNGGSEIQHWDGKAWSLVGMPGPREYGHFGVFDGYAGITGSSPTDLWAGGEVGHIYPLEVLNRVAHWTCG